MAESVQKDRTVFYRCMLARFTNDKCYPVGYLSGDQDADVGVKIDFVIAADETRPHIGLRETLAVPPEWNERNNKLTVEARLHSSSIDMSTIKIRQVVKFKVVETLDSTEEAASDTDTDSSPPITIVRRIEIDPDIQIAFEELDPILQKAKGFEHSVEHENAH